MLVSDLSCNFLAVLFGKPEFQGSSLRKVHHLDFPHLVNKINNNSREKTLIRNKH